MDEVTADEVSRLARAMKEPEFQTLFREYLDEISDPQSRAEYETYLSDLEAKGEVPRGRKLLRAEPGACLKTHLLFPSGSRQKLYVNLCRSVELGEVSLSSSEKGSHISIPHALSPPRPDKDSKGQNCLTVDMAVHPSTVTLAMANEAVLRVCMDICAETLNSQHFRGREEVSKDFKILKIACKGGSPLPMSVASDMAQTPLDNGQTVNSGQTVTPLELARMQEAAIAKQPEKPEQPEISTPPPIPSYSVVEVGNMEISNFMGSESQPTPSSLRITLYLPGIKKASEICLDCSDGFLTADVNSLNFQVAIPLRFMVDKDRVSAKFEKASESLIVTIPVVGRLCRPEQVDSNESIDQLSDDEPPELISSESSETEIGDSEAAEINQTVEPAEMVIASRSSNSDRSADVCDVVGCGQNGENIWVKLSAKSQPIPESWKFKGNRNRGCLSFISEDNCHYEQLLIFPQNRGIDIRQIHCSIDGSEICFVARKSDSEKWADIFSNDLAHAPEEVCEQVTEHVSEEVCEQVTEHVSEEVSEDVCEEFGFTGPCDSVSDPSLLSYCHGIRLKNPFLFQLF